MVALIKNKNVITVKAKATVCVNASSVKEVEDLGDDEGSGKTKPNVGWVAEERATERWAVSIVDKAEGGVDGRVGVTGVGADSEGWDTKEVGLELVGGGDVGVVVNVGLERGNGWESRRGAYKVSVGLKA